MKPIRSMTNAELAAFIESCLRKKGIDVVLSGGTCVSIYSENRYVSMDLDLVNAHFAKRSEISAVMREIGFREEGRHFTHPETDFFVEFPAGPLAVGEEPVKEVHEITLDTGTLKIISPTDCVKNRLAAYYYWNDAQCLEQASLVAQARKIDLAEVERWSEVEGKLDEFRQIKDRLVSGPTLRSRT
ncbi:MAG: hypothetical protein ABIJ00_00860 [Candidatus Eisenbacteria bacterium]